MKEKMGKEDSLEQKHTFARFKVCRGYVLVLESTVFGMVIESLIILKPFRNLSQ